MSMMPLSSWLLALALFAAAVVLAHRLKPAFIWRDVSHPVTEVRSAKGFDDLSATVEIAYTENGEAKVATMSVADFKRLVTDDPVSGKRFFHGKAPDLVIAGVCLAVSAAVSVAASWAFSSA